MFESRLVGTSLNNFNEVSLIISVNFFSSLDLLILFYQEKSMGKPLAFFFAFIYFGLNFSIRII